MELIVQDNTDGLDVIKCINLKGLYSTEKASVQPNVLLRTPVFSPVGRNIKESLVKKNLSTELRGLEICQKDGYDHISIKGPKLNVETDFRVWCGVVLAFSKYGLNGNTIKMQFTEFAKFCGYKTKRIDSKLRTQIDNSLSRIQQQQLSFKNHNSKKALITGLLHRAVYDIEEDRLELIADETLWDLYQIDRRVLVSMNVISKLPRAEVAQCLYLYFLALPKNPYPVSFSRLRERLQLISCKKDANKRIKAGIEKLENIGFISGSFARKEGETYYLVNKKDSKLLL